MSNPQSRRPPLTLAACAILLYAASVSAAPPNPPAALLVACDDCKQGAKLQHAVSSAVELADRLYLFGWRVKVMTRPDDVQRVTDALKSRREKRQERDKRDDRGKPSNDPPEVEAIPSAKKLEGFITDEWCVKAVGRDYKDAGRFGLLVFTGHGVTRDEKGYFLTHDDSPQSGGVCLDVIETALVKRQAPVVMVVNTCRNRPPGAGAGPQARQGDVPALEDSLPPGSPRARVTHYYGANPGDFAPDVEYNLTRCLAEGLRRDGPRGAWFVAQTKSLLDDIRWSARPREAGDLTLGVWFKFASVLYNEAASEFKTGKARFGGAVTEEEAVASNWSFSQTATQDRRLADLLAGAGDFNRTDITAQRVGNVLRLTRKTGGEPDFATMYVTVGLDKAHDPGGKTLALGMFAEGRSVSPVVQVLQTGVAGSPFNPDTAGTKLVVGRGKPRLFYIPLAANDDRHTDRVGFGPKTSVHQFEVNGDWPAGASVVVTRLDLVETGAIPERTVVVSKGEEVHAGNRINEAALYPNLVARWWLGDVPPTGLDRLRIELVAQDGTVPPLRFESRAANQPKPGWQGGELLPAVYVPAMAKKVTVRGQLSAAADGSELASVRLYNRSEGGEPVAVVIIRPPKGERAFEATADLKRDRAEDKSELPVSVDYMTIRTNGSPVLISSVTAQP